MSRCEPCLCRLPRKKRRVYAGKDGAVSAKDAATNAKDAATSTIQKRSRAKVRCCVLLHTCTLLCVVALQDTARHSKTQQDTARHSQTQHDTKRHAARYIGSVAVSVSVVQCFVERRAVSCGAPTRLASLGAIRMSHSYEPHGLPNEPYNESKEPYYESKKPHKESK